MTLPIIVFQAGLSPEEQAILRLIANYQTAIAIAVVASIAAVALGVVFFVYEHWLTPLESKNIRSASRKKRPLLILGGDDGYADLKDAPFSGPEGIVQTKKIGRTQEHYTGALPRPREFDETEIEVAPNKDLKKTTAIANFVSMLANRRLLLRGARVPVWVAYRGKAILASLYGLAALQVLEGLERLPEFKESFAAIDVVAIKSLFSEQWNESQINAQETDAERVGELKAKRWGGKESLLIVFVVMIIFVVALIMLLVVGYYFK